ncbi:hypothetical protein A4A49_43682, partial [Nicotiana attenuata]
MPTAPSSTGGKPPDHHQNDRPAIAHPPQQVSTQTNTPARTDLQISEAITVHDNRLGVSKIPHSKSSSPIQILNRGDCSPHQGAPPVQFSDLATVKNPDSGKLKNSGKAQTQATNASVTQMEKERYQNVSNIARNNTAPSIAHGYHPIDSILQSNYPTAPTGPSVRQNVTILSKPIRDWNLIGGVSSTSLQSPDTISH